MEQKHVFDGLRYGDKSKRGLLAEQIVGVNSKLLQQALENIAISTKRCSATELISAIRTKHVKSSLMISKEVITCANEEKLGADFKLQEKGLSLFSKGKVAIVLVLNDIEKGKGDNPGVVDSESSENSLPFFLQKSLSDDQAFVKIEDRASVPLILVCPAQETQSLQKLFSNNDYFAFRENSSC
ncbi:16S RRNA PROCESSING PROTEIN RIMM FAMILY [Salix koriyanagi]|uniref:16S RRNA PROCESSING PROTEIN RIMM FAMILY n=1 Tax=Salix koriyanagi TaxID=2511006 RepID=A0A9Q0X0N3_9ROSI|nr:16S RRNA PROCESSING PROTEIN RIMM FAMILY [Salix koriyanagi]